MNWLPLFVAVPLGMAFLTPLFSRWWKAFPDVAGNLATGCVMVLSLLALPFAGRTTVYYVGGWEPVNGIPIGIHMAVDGLTVLMLLVVNVVAFLSTLYSVSYMKRYTDKAKYTTLFLLMVTGLNGVVISGDLFNIFVFFEITAIACYVQLNSQPGKQLGRHHLVGFVVLGEQGGGSLEFVPECCVRSMAAYLNMQPLRFDDRVVERGSGNGFRQEYIDSHLGAARLFFFSGVRADEHDGERPCLL